jgi:hypothetical protein
VLLQEHCCELPSELLANVLRRVDLQQRITTCTLVCRSWRTAAAAVTTDISIWPYVPAKDKNTRDLDEKDAQQQPPPQLKSLLAWLNTHGSFVEGLRIREAGNEESCYALAYLAFFRPVLQLPCHQLQQLQRLTVSGMQLQPDPAAAAAAAVGSRTSISSKRVTRSTTRGSKSCSIGTSKGSGNSGTALNQAEPPLLSGLSSLTKLHLERCSISGWAGGLAGLQLLTQLQHLQLEDLLPAVLALHGSSFHVRRNYQPSLELDCVLPKLTALTHLSLKQNGLKLRDAALLQNLRQLQELQLDNCSISNKVLAQLPASLRVLSILMPCKSHAPPCLVLDSSNSVRLRQLSKLRRLQLPGVTVRDVAGLLGALTQLTRLTLDSR